MVLTLIFSCGSENNKKDSKKNKLESKEIKDEQVAWELLDVVDEFNDVIDGQKSIGASFKGKFSNSVIANESLTVKMQIQDSIMVAFFYEYNREPIANLPSSKYLNIKLKKSNGEILEVKQLLYQNMMIDNDKELLKIVLQENKPLKVIVDISKVDKYSKTIYNFDLDPSGLKEKL